MAYAPALDLTTLFEVICLRAPLALMVRHFSANFQGGGEGGGGSAYRTRARRPPRGLEPANPSLGHVVTLHHMHIQTDWQGIRGIGQL